MANYHGQKLSMIFMDMFFLYWDSKIEVFKKTNLFIYVSLRSLNFSDCLLAMFFWWSFSICQVGSYLIPYLNSLVFFFQEKS